MALTRPRAAQIYDIDYKQATRVVTVSNITLSGGAPSTVDSVSLTLNDRILVTGQSTASQNGIYYVSTLGSGSNGTWTRSTDTNTVGEILPGTIVMVTEGTIYADTQWKLTTDGVITPGVTAQTWVQNYSANSIISGNSNVTILSNSSVLVSSAGTANVAKFDSANVTFAANLLPASNVTYSLGTTSQRWSNIWLSNSTIYLGNVNLSANDTALTVNGANVLTGNAGATFSTSGNVIGSNILTGGYVSATGNLIGNYLLGNGSQITGIVASAGAAITNGNSNVTVGANSNVTVAVSSTTVTTFAATGIYLPGLLSATGNVTGNYILGNGALLTGVITSVANINNGTSNVTVVSSGGNITVGVGGTANVAVFATTGEYITGVLSASGNVTGSNVLTAGYVSATGNITGSYVIGNGSQLTGLPAGYSNATAASFLAAFGSNTISTSGNITGGNILYGAGIVSGTGNVFGNVATFTTSNGTTFSASGNITGGNILTGGLISATGNITGGNITIPGSANISTFIGNVFFGSVPAQPTYYNIAPLNINNSLAAATKVQLNLINTGGGAGAGSGIDFYTYQISVAAANAEARIAGIDDGNYSAYLSLQTKTPGSTGTNTLVERVKIDSTGASVVANITGGNILTGGLISSTGNAIHGNLLTSGLISVTGNITGGNVLGGANVNATTHTGTTVSVTANITGGNLLTGGLISATGNITGGNLLTGGLVSATSTITSAATITGGNLATGGTASATGNITGGNILTGGLVSATGNITGGNLLTGGLISATSTITSAANITGGNILTAGIMSSTGNAIHGNILTGGLISATGNVTGGNVIISGSGGNITGANVISATTISTSQILNSAANGVGNIGNATTYFNTVFAKSTSAQYADLAEMYSADADYAPGTVVEFGGNQEITISSRGHSTQVAGIISTNPSYLMNSAQSGEHVLPVALTGRVPCRVVGTICKGDRLVASSIAGVATILDKNFYEPGCIIGKALEDYDSITTGIIEVAVGRF